jgi:hypothetical protein
MYEFLDRLFDVAVARRDCGFRRARSIRGNSALS